jgi:hypothetical protein
MAEGLGLDSRQFQPKLVCDYLWFDFYSLPLWQTNLERVNAFAGWHHTDAGGTPARAISASRAAT